MRKFKEGDRVRHKESGTVGVVKSVPGMVEYDNKNFCSADEGFVLENNNWRFQEDWELVQECEPLKPFEAGKTAEELGIDFSRKFVVVNGGGYFPNGTIVTCVGESDSVIPRFTDGKKEYSLLLHRLAYAPEEKPQEKPDPHCAYSISTPSGETLTVDTINGVFKEVQNLSSVRYGVEQMWEYNFYDWYLNGGVGVNKSNKNKTKKIMSTIKNIFKSEERKALEHYDIVNGDGGLTQKGQLEFVDFLFEKNKEMADEFKKVIVAEFKKETQK
jgi:hypothetical protein